LKQLTKIDSTCGPGSTRSCNVCGKPPAPVRLPFAVGRQDTPPLPREYRALGLGRRKKKFFQRYRWVWYTLWLCHDCGESHPSEWLWTAIQNHPGTRELVEKGYTETRLGSEFDGQEGEVTFSEEPV